MKERDFYKEVMRRGFEPDFDELSERIQGGGSPQSGTDARVRSRSFAAVAAAAVIGAGLAGVLALTTSRYRTAESEPPSADEVAVSAADSTDESSVSTVHNEPRPYICYNDEIIYDDNDWGFDENGMYMGYNMYRGVVIEELDSFFKDKKFLGVVTENTYDTGKITGKRLETNAFPVGTPVFRSKSRKLFYFWVQKDSVTADIYEFGNAEEFGVKPLGNVFYIDDINKQAELVRGKVLEVDQSRNCCTVGIERESLYDPNDDRLKGLLWTVTFDKTVTDEDGREVELTIPESRYVFSDLDDIREGMYVRLEVAPDHDENEYQPFKAGYVYRLEEDMEESSE